jgi:hypothetical protein
MITLRQFYEAAAPVHGLGIEPARMLGRLLFQGRDEAVARANGGKDASPWMTPFLAAQFLIGRFSGGQQKDAAIRVGGLWFTTRDGVWSEVATILGDNVTTKEPALCPITGQITFGDAVRAILSDAGLAAQIAYIEIQHGQNDATVVAKDGRVTRFVSREAIDAVAGQTFSRIPDAGLVFVANLIAPGA